MEAQESLQTKIIQLEYMNQQIKAMQLHLADLEKAVEELSILKVGLTNMEGARKGDEMLVPLGASSYVRANVIDASKVMVSIGAGVFVDKTVKEAAPIVKKQVDELQNQEEIVIQNISMLSQEADKIAAELNKELKAG
jgi:prefoldin alpha subunit